MEFKKRKIEEKILKLANIYPVVLIVGARQTGKTALSKHLFPDHKWVLLDDSLLATQANEDPQLFLKNNPTPIIIDEIQRAPNLFLEIKNLIDSKKGEMGDFILTGSQPLPLMQNASESLTGRIGIAELYPMTASEIFEIKKTPKTFRDWINNPPIGEKYLWQIPPFEFLMRGGLPMMALKEGSLDIETACQRINDYIQTYLKKDLRDISSIQSLGMFEKFLRVLATSSSRIQDYSDLSSLSGIPRTTVISWHSILKSSYIVWEAQSFHSNYGKREKKRPKNFLIDTGILCNLLGVSSSESLSKNPLLGLVAETSAASALKSLICSSFGQEDKIFHWRYENKYEVDLVIELSSIQILPVEIKLTSKPNLSDCQGLQFFIEKYPEKAKLALIVSTHETCFWLSDKILHIPLSAI